MNCTALVHFQSVFSCFRQHGENWFRVTLCCALILLMWVPCQAQDQKEKPERDLPGPESFQVSTADGLSLSARYFAPVRSGKETPVVVLLHMNGRDQKSWDNVALALQNKKIAALTVDLRGHGDSKAYVNGARWQKETLRRSDFLAMVRQDMESVKAELVRRHNHGLHNIERLGIVGAELGATVAVLWACFDWTNADGARQDYPTVSDGMGKRGRDVKSLVLLSPQYNFKGVRLRPLETQLLKTRLSVSLLWGSKDRKYNRDGQRIHRGIQISRRGQDDMDHLASMFETRLQGTDLLRKEVSSQGVQDQIVNFLNKQLHEGLTGVNIVWKQRRTPFNDILQEAF